MVVMISCAFIIIIMAFFCGGFGIGTFSSSVTNFTSPGITGVWDVITFTGTGLVDLFGFQIADAGIIMSLITYIMVVIIAICVVYLARGTQ